MDTAVAAVSITTIHLPKQPYTLVAPRGGRALIRSSGDTINSMGSTHNVPRAHTSWVNAPNAT